ncbi:AraC family transcriptional regulator [Paenibacillus albidus]|uniref:AraC family transcriptional regulator n=1 Tax=Paenibacillus albidus TaxID=2041023 RepID=UPI001BEBED6B|nr:AraC family transcriptional regulator [Paenibacillus albidus]MBT2293337.1 AraC family transcriptional regulator [Paenibacillus albidus]
MRTQTGVSRETAGGQKSRMGLSEVRQYMEQHYDQPLTIEQLSGMAGISAKYFVNLFKKTYGQSAMEYLTDIRINRAKRYLSESDERLRDIAHKVGYSDEFYFSRKFKKEVGMPPSAYSRQTGAHIAACSPAMMGQLLALGIVPVAAPLDPKWTPYYYNAYALQIKVHLKYGGELQEADGNKLAKVRPDKWIGTEPLPKEARRRVEDAAQTLIVSPQHLDWKEQLLQIAGYVEREEQSSTWLAAYEIQMQRTRDKLSSVIGEDTVIVLRIYGTGLYAYCNRGIRDVLYQDLQLSPAYEAGTLYNDELSLETLVTLDPGRILILICAEPASRAAWLSLQRNKGWQKLRAVRSAEVYPIPSDPWYEYSAVAVSRMMDEMLLLFTGKCPNPLIDTVHGSPGRGKL